MTKASDLKMLAKTMEIMQKSLTSIQGLILEQKFDKLLEPYDQTFATACNAWSDLTVDRKAMTRYLLTGDQEYISHLNRADQSNLIQLYEYVKRIELSE